MSKRNEPELLRDVLTRSLNELADALAKRLAQPPANDTAPEQKERAG
jgi:hypothetical protein